MIEIERVPKVHIFLNPRTEASSVTFHGFSSRDSLKFFLDCTRNTTTPTFCSSSKFETWIFISMVNSLKVFPRWDLPGYSKISCFWRIRNFQSGFGMCLFVVVICCFQVNFWDFGFCICESFPGNSLKSHFRSNLTSLWPCTWLQTVSLF